jgi:drug/metabolite transporter (DMT)-like permease
VSGPAPEGRARSRGLFAGLLSAALFGAATPFAKLLLPRAGPLLLAGIFYLGAAAALTLALFLRRLAGGAAGESPLLWRDLPLLTAIGLLGGIAGPLCMLWGLSRVSGFAGSLLLNLEGPFTLGLALLVFGEHVERREAAAAALVVAGAALLGAAPGPLRADPLGALAIALACLAWGLDNNLTQRLSLRDPLAIARAKTLGAGACTLGLSLLLGDRLPAGPPLAGALLVGALGYGASIALDVVALRELGAARESAIFASAPFAGALLSLLVLGDRPSWADAAAAAVLLAGVLLLLRARHAHRHAHPELLHQHRHVHDAHHQHSHQGLALERDAAGRVVEPHAHEHRHEPLVHDHPHVSDAHHRHGHR